MYIRYFLNHKVILVPTCTRINTISLSVKLVHFLQEIRTINFNMLFPYTRIQIQLFCCTLSKFLNRSIRKFRNLYLQIVYNINCSTTQIAIHVVACTFDSHSYLYNLRRFFFLNKPLLLYILVSGEFNPACQRYIDWTTWCPRR